MPNVRRPTVFGLARLAVHAYTQATILNFLIVEAEQIVPRKPV